MNAIHEPETSERLAEGPRGRMRSIAPHLLFAAVAILFVSAPLLFTDWTNAADFTNAFWYASLRAWQIGHGQATSYYIQAYPTGLFTPFFAFYGGGLFSAVGILALAIGNHPIAAFEIVGVAAFASAYGGSYWIGRICGLNRVLAHVPGLVVITSAYWSTVIYGRGDWPEFIGISAIPTVIAAGAAILRSERLRLWPALAFLVSGFFFVASHAITLTWGTTLIGLIGLSLLALYRWRFPFVRLVKLAALLALDVLIDAWALAPIAAYSSDVRIAHYSVELGPDAAPFFDPFSVLFWPFRRVPSESGTPALFVQAPDWFLVWALVVIGAFVVARRRWSGRRGALVLMASFVVLSGLVLSTATWRLPNPWKQIQFPYRLDSYIALTAAGLVLIALLALQAARRKPQIVGFSALGVAIVVSTVICCWQLFVPNTEQPLVPNSGGSLATRAAALTGPNTPPASFEAFDDYADAISPQLSPPTYHFWFPLRELSPNQESLTATVQLPVSGMVPIDTNISGGPEFITISGDVHRVGDDPLGRAVIERNSPGDGPVRVVITTNHNWMSYLPYVTGLGILLAVGLLVWLATGEVLRRRARPEPAGVLPAPSGATPIA